MESQVSRWIRKQPLRLLCLAAVLASFFLLQNGCGGGGSTSNPPPPPPPAPVADFGLTASPSSFSLAVGNSAPVIVSTTAINGFASTINVTVSGLPSGVTVAPTTAAMQPGTQQSFTLTAASNAPLTSATVQFTGTSGALTRSTQSNLTLFAAPSPNPPSRTRYLRTDARTQYFAWLNSHWIIFHAATARFFVTDPESGHVFVLDSVTQKVRGRIDIPGAFGIDDSPDHGALYVGTLSGDVYAVDPVAMTVTRRYLASQIGPYGFQAFTALGLADGRLALLGAQGGIPSVDGSPSFAIWNPADNSITIYASGYGQGQLGGVPATLVCGGMGNIGGFERTPDRTRLILGSIFSDGTLCAMDTRTGRDTYISTNPFSTIHITVSPDGKYVILPKYPDQVLVYDGPTLNKIGEIDVTGDTSSGASLTVTPDSKTLLIPQGSILNAYDIATHQRVGWIPALYLPSTSGGFVVGPTTGPNLPAADGTGLLAGPMEEGVGFVDLSTLRPGPAGTIFTNAYLNPASGPASGGTQTQWSTFDTVTSQSNIYFGGQRAISVSKSGFFVVATTPPGPPGPVDVYAFAADGAVQIVPEGFSYGPTVLQVTPNTATAAGGGTGFIYGYGLGPSDATDIPADLTVRVGGMVAKVIRFDRNAYHILSPPFLLQAAAYTIPPGALGSADVTVTNNSGTATIREALTYIPDIESVPLPGSALTQGVYDRYRDLYYFADANKVQVFSMPQRAWLAPINIPAVPGRQQRLWGLALSPDGTKLAISDASAGAIYLVDVATIGPVRTFPLTLSNPQGLITNPCGIAVSDAGIVYFAVFGVGGTGFGSYFKLDTKTGIVTNYRITGPGLGTTDLYLRLAISSDNTRVYFNNLGHVFTIDTATDTVFRASLDTGCCYGDYELSLSSNQTRFSATSFLYDSDLNNQSFITLNFREVGNISYVYGAKLSPDGSLFFQPSANGIDVFDGRIGHLRTRVSLPLALSPNYDALVANGKDNVLLAITGANGDGVAIVDLRSISEPPPLPYGNELATRPEISTAPDTRNRIDVNTTAHRSMVRRHTISHLTKTPN